MTRLFTSPSGNTLRSGWQERLMSTEKKEARGLRVQSAGVNTAIVTQVPG